LISAEQDKLSMLVPVA